MDYFAVFLLVSIKVFAYLALGGMVLFAVYLVLFHIIEFYQKRINYKERRKV